jgi:hypothetical protein
MAAVHACVCLDTWYVGLYQTTTHFLEVTKAVDACGTVKNVEESNTELSEKGGHWRKKRETKLVF